MPESDRTVKCPICDADFDPTVAGGWCTNPDCGEWQHTDETATEFDAEDGASNDADLLAEGGDETQLSDGRSVAASDQVDTTAGHTTDDDDTGASAAADSDTGAAEAEDGAAETATEDNAADDTEDDHQRDPVADEDVDRPSEAGDEPDESGDAADPAEPSDETPDADEAAATITCPDCERELDADANFCLDCGADVQDVTPGDDGSLDACPACDTAVDDDASFCVNCGENLDAHRGEAGASKTDSESGSSTADEMTDEPAAADNAVETLASQSSDDGTVPDELVLSVEGRDITVGDGDRIGREIRAALLDAGRPEDEAVRIHREHVRFDRQPDGFYLVDLGDNPTRLNGTPLKKGDREPVHPGDELELSGVVTVTIRAA